MLKRSVIPWLILTVAGISGQVVAQDSNVDSNPVDWHTGKALEEFNELAISAWWTDVEFRDRIMRFSVNQRRAIFLDRRIDPSQLVSLSLKNVTSERFLWSAAQQCGAGVCRIEDFYYIGPHETVSVLPAVCDQIRKTTSQKRRASMVDWTKRATLVISGPTEPKQILATLAQENNFRINNIEAVPHDLWAEFELPRTSLQIRVAILLAGFNKSFERNADGTEINIVDMPTVNKTEVTYRNLDDVSKLAQQLRPKYPNLKISVKSKRLVASGEPSSIEKLGFELTTSQIPIVSANAQQVYTLRQRSSRGSILATAAQIIKSKLTFDRSDSGISDSLREQFEINAVDASPEQLINIALQGTDLTYEILSGELRIRRK